MQDTRGRWASEGDFYPFRDEADDGCDTIEWASRLPGSDGKVGMYGYSYPGAVQLLAAACRPPSLATICPGFTSSNFYEGWVYGQGAFHLATSASWTAFLATDTARRRDNEALERAWSARRNAVIGYWSLPLRDYPPLKGLDVGYFYDWIAHPTYDEYWRRWSLDEDYGRIAIPALHLGGWYDAFLTGTVQTFVSLRQLAGGEDARRHQKLLIGPWIHSPWIPLADASDSGVGPTTIDDWQLRWFDRFLKGRDTGVLDSPVTVYVMGDGWRDFDDWPPTTARSVDYYLHSDGRANCFLGDGVLSEILPSDESADVFYYDPAMPCFSEGGHSCCAEDIAPMGPECQRANTSQNRRFLSTLRDRSQATFGWWET